MSEVEVGDTVIVKGVVTSVKNGYALITSVNGMSGTYGVSTDRITEVIKRPRPEPGIGSHVLAADGSVYSHKDSHGWWRGGVVYPWDYIESLGRWQEMIPEDQVDVRRKPLVCGTTRQEEPGIGAIVECSFGFYKHSMPGDMSIMEANASLNWVNIASGRRATWGGMTGSGMRTLKVWLPEKKES